MADHASIINTYFLIFNYKILLQYPTSLFVFATLMTSAWLWVYILGALAVRAMSTFGWFLSWISLFTNFKVHPARVLGGIASVTSAIFVLLASLVLNLTIH